MEFKKLIVAGFALIPVPYRQKGPVIPGWNERIAAVTDPHDVGRLHYGNVGLAHAYCTPNPTCALDIDHYKLARQWLKTHSVDLKEYLLAEDAVAIWSGKPQSIKLLYRLPDGYEAMQTKQVSGADGRMMLEFRCASQNGKTVQDLLPPSIHPSGTEYTWVGKGSPLAPPILPQKLLNIWTELSKRRKGPCKKSQRDLSSWPETPRRIAQVRQMLSYISADTDYQTWRNVCWGLLSTGWAAAVEIAKEWSQTAPGCYDEAAFHRVVASFVPDHSAGHSIGTVIHFAKLGGWHE